MAGQQSKGKCSFCGTIFGKGGMRRHLESCKDREIKPGKDEIFHIVVECGPMYWMHLDVLGSATLKDMDKFLRFTWLECCGHLSAFTIQGVRYMSDPYDSEDKGMKNAEISKVICPGMKFIHEYDFGTTTELDLRVLSERKGKLLNDVEILARNEPPEFICDLCGKPATEVCTMCVYEDKGLLCDECAEKHECGEEMLLPVVNSPRWGVCGYVG